MAPSRKKGRAAAAAAAAAQRQWKVGDLVLAKMKGFPPWPAAISEPQKWGFSSDKKKLFVYFFGTKQIAFCNHADIEAFTEEKKKNLLAKRQGKGADFVRAVEEIADSFEKLNEHNISSELGSDDEGVKSNSALVECTCVSSSIKSSKEPLYASNCQSDTICTSTQGICSQNSEEPSSIQVEMSTIQNNGVISEHTNGKISILDHLRRSTLSPIGSLRKRSRETTSQKAVAQKRTLSLRRSRSSTMIGSHELQTSDTIVEADGCQNDSLPNILLEECSLENKAIGRSPVVLNGKFEVSTLVPNDTCDDRIEVAGSGFLILNEGCKMEMSHKGRAVDIQRKTIVPKKKRKLNKKRVDQDFAGYIKVENETDVQVETNESQTLADSCQDIDGKHDKKNGDEHLPLVKRARVRMGNVPKEKLDGLIDTTEESQKVPLAKHEQNITNGKELDARKASNSSPTNDCTIAKDHGSAHEKGSSYSLRVDSVDVEAALPPSKRLHRALEAMSANAAEASFGNLEDSDSKHLSCDNNFSRNESSHMTLLESSKNPNESHGTLPAVSNSMPILPMGSALQNQNVHTGCHSDEECIDMFEGNSEGLRCLGCTNELVDVNGFKDLSPKIVIEKSKPSFPAFKDKTTTDSSNHSALSPSSFCVIKHQNKEDLQFDKEHPIDVIRREDSDMCVGDLESGSGSSKVEKVDCALKVEECGDFLPSGVAHAANSNYVASIGSFLAGERKQSSSLSDEKCGVNTQEATAELECKSESRRTCFSPDSTPMKVLIAAAQAKRFLSRSSSLSENTNHKHVSDGGSSTFFLYRGNSACKISPPDSVVNHQHSLDEETSSLQSSNRSPVASMQFKNSIQFRETDVQFDSITHKQKSLYKHMGHAEGAAARKAFEGLLPVLSRTKESIGRATRLAIECAKYGIANEVVQLLLQSLEKELKLSRRLDLFFLVDSIAQCSRGQKGAAGDAYPPLLQSVLPRLLCATAPPGNAAWDNRMQCLKVLRLWLERKILSESVVRKHIGELESVNEASFSSLSTRRPSRTERPLNDPVREMEGMLVDEYGSNASFQIAGFLGACILDEEETADDEKSFEAVTPEHDADNCREADATGCIRLKHTLILEDVDGELEMEDVSPPREAGKNSTHDTGVCTDHVSDHVDSSNSLLPPPPPLPTENPPSPPPLPSSPPPVPPLCPSISSLLPPPPTISHSHTDVSNSCSYVDRSNMQYSSSDHQASTPSLNLMSSNRMDHFAPGYVDQPKQFPVSSLKSSSSFYPGGSCPSLRSINDAPTLSGRSLHSNSYHIPPPPPVIASQFSQSQTDKHVQPWRDCPLFDRRAAFSTEAQGSQFLGDARGLSQHEVSERCRSSAAVHSGPMLPDNIGASSKGRAYHGPTENSTVPGPGWTFHARTSTYSFTTSRPRLENQVSRVIEARDYWRPG